MVPLEALNIPRNSALLWKQIYRTVIQSQVIEISLEDLLCYWSILVDRLLTGEQACTIHIFFQSVYRRLWKAVSWLLWEITFLTILGKRSYCHPESSTEFLLSHPQPPAERFQEVLSRVKERMSMCARTRMHVLHASTLTSLPHSVDRRQLPQSKWGTIRDNGMLSDLPRVALSSRCWGALG